MIDYSTIEPLIDELRLEVLALQKTEKTTIVPRPGDPMAPVLKLVFAECLRSILRAI